MGALEKICERRLMAMELIEVPKLSNSNRCIAVNFLMMNDSIGSPTVTDRPSSG